MKKEINLEDIFNNYSEVDCDYSYTKESILLAMKEACNQCLDLAAENVKVEDDILWRNVNQNSILQIKDWIK